MKKLLMVLFACMLLAAGCLAVGCNKETEKLEADIPKDATAEIGLPYTVETVEGKYGDESVTAEVSVTYGGEEVAFEASSFTPDKLGEYVVTYAFSYGNGKSKAFTQTVTCIDTVAPTIVLDESAALPYKVQAGETVTVGADLFSVKDRSGEALTASVSVYAGETEDESKKVALSQDGSFEASASAGEGYLVVASVADSSGNAGRYTRFISLFEEGEMEYFNNREYAETNILPGKNGGAVEYNTDSQYVFEGTGSLKFSFGTSGYPSAVFKNTPEFDFTDCAELSFWVYNPGSAAARFRMMVTKDAGGGEKGLVGGNDDFTIQPNRWTNIRISGETIRKTLAEEGDYAGYKYLVIFATKDWYEKVPDDYVLYFDTFKIYTQSPDFAIDAENTEVNIDEQTQATVLLTSSGLKNIADITHVTAQIFKDDGTLLETVSADANGISYEFKEEGSYTVYYLYRNGADGCTAEQRVTVYSNATLADYRDDYGLIDFDNKGELDGNVYSVGYGAGTVSRESVDGNNVLKFESASNSQWTNLQIKAPVFGQLCEGDSFRFRMYVDKGTSDAESYNLRVKKIDPKEEVIYGQDNIETGKWLTITISDPEVIAQIIENQLIWVAVDCNSAGNYGWILYLDDLEVVKNETISLNNNESVEEAVTALFASGTQVAVSVKDTDGEDVTFGQNGEIAVPGEYTVTAIASAQGFNDREYTFRLTVKDSIIFSFEVPDDVTVDLNTEFTVPSVTGMYGDESVTPSVSVTFKGEPVQLTDGKFMANELGEYIITYSFTYGYVTDDEYTQTVSCGDRIAPEVVGPWEDKIVSAGESVDVNIFSATDNSGETITVEVHVYKEKEEGEEVQAENGAFTAEDGVTKYIVVARGSDSSDNTGKFVCTVYVIQSEEFAYFNEEYLFNEYVSVGKNGGNVEYNTNSQYVFEGTGSLKFSFGTSGYPSAVFKNTPEFDFTDCAELSFWVYNPGSAAARFRMMVTKDAGGGEKGLVGGNDDFTIQPNRWTNIRISGETIRKTLAEEGNYAGYKYLVIFASGDWYTSIPNDYTLYFDAFKMYAQSAGVAIHAKPSVSINIDDTGAAELLAPSEIVGIQDFSAVSAQIFKGDGTLLETVSADASGIIYEFKEEGPYSVHYIYRSGADGCTAAQSVAVYKLGDREFAYFNDESSFGECVSVGANGGSAEYSQEYVLEGAGSLKFSFAGSSWPKAVFNNTPEFDFSDCAELSFWVYNPTATAWDFRVMVTQEGGNGEKGLVGGGDQFTAQPNAWTNIRISGEKIRNSLAEEGTYAGYKYLVLFASKDWYGSIPSDCVLYFDAFSIIETAA